MSENTILLLFFGACVPIGGYIAFQWWRLLNTADGERWMKQRMQGPFVPLSADEVAEDDARKRR